MGGGSIGRRSAVVSVGEYAAREKREGYIPPTPHILACFGCCLTWSSYSRLASMAWRDDVVRGRGEEERDLKLGLGREA
jgi:hypothetical protein